MSALIFRGDQTLSETMVLAYTAQRALSSVPFDRSSAEDSVAELLSHVWGLAGLEWWFTINNLETPEQADALRRELLAHRDYVQSALFVTTGAVGDAVAWLLEHTLPERLAGFSKARMEATAKIKELDLALKFLLEEEDPNGEVEQTFAVAYPGPQPNSPSSDFDFN